MELDVTRLRADFPALALGTAFFDSPGGTQTPTRVADAVATTMTAGLSNRGSVTAAERRADDVVAGARRAVADLLGCEPDGVVFARSMTQATYDVARTLAKDWSAGDEVVVTRLDHDANIRPWVHAAGAVGATVRWVGFDRETADLTLDDVVAQLSDRTRLVAVTGASNTLGSRPDLPAIAEAVHAAGALLYVDGVHLTPHSFVDVVELGADFYACSPYKFFGPHHGLVVARPGLWERLHPDKLLPSSNAVPERFELGTLPYEILAGTTAAIDLLADLAGTVGHRRDRLRDSFAAIEAHEDRLFDRLLDGLAAIPGLTLHGRPKRRTPTAYFSVDGVPSADVYAHLAGLDVNVPASTFYAIEASRWLGLGDSGAVRAGLAPYTDEGDVDRLLAGLGSLPRD